MTHFPNASVILILINCLANVATSAWCQLYVYTSSNRGGTQWGPFDINSCLQHDLNFYNDVVSSAFLTAEDNYACIAIFYNHCGCGGNDNPSETLTVDAYSSNTINFGTVNNEISCITLTVTTPNPTAQTETPTIAPTIAPTITPTINPTSDPSLKPTESPSILPTNTPSSYPTHIPSLHPTNEPTFHPSIRPTVNPTFDPTVNPTNVATTLPTYDPSTLDAEVLTNTTTADIFTSEYVIKEGDMLLNYTYMLWIIIIASLILCCICCIVVIGKCGLLKSKQKESKSNMSSEIALASNNNLHMDRSLKDIAQHTNNFVNDENVIGNISIQRVQSNSLSSTDIVNIKITNDNSQGMIIREPRQKVTIGIDEKPRQKIIIGIDEKPRQKVTIGMDDEFIIHDDDDELPLDQAIVVENGNSIGERQLRIYSEGPKHNVISDTQGE